MTEWDIYHAGLDYWGVRTQARELSRIERTLAPFQGCHFARGLDVGCSEGFVTAQMAEFCDEMTGIDIASAAINRATEEFPDVEFQVADMLRPETWDVPPPTFLACLEAFYYVPAQDQADLLEAFVEGGAPDCVYLFSVVTHNWPDPDREYFDLDSARELLSGPLNLLGVWQVSPSQTAYMGVRR